MFDFTHAASLIKEAKNAIPLLPISESHFSEWLPSQSITVQNWIHQNGFQAELHTFCLIPDENGELYSVLVGVGSTPDLYALAHLPFSLANQVAYVLQDPEELLKDIPVEVGWALGAYQFTAFKKAKRDPAQLIWRDSVNQLESQSLIDAIYLVRDLINLPANVLTPARLAQETQELATQFGASYQMISGKSLLQANYPTIYAVGQASEHEPCLAEFCWGNPDHPKVTLVGKGVCFDSGGLDLKPSDGMLDMKKDMGGAAHVLGLAYLMMMNQLPVRLRVLIPAVENAVSGSAYRPRDIIKTRQGLTVEITNTDAEGRLILCDALAEASREKPDLLLDFATLTGAARIAMGTDLSPFFASDKNLSVQLQKAAEKVQDPVYPLPLYKPYRKLLKSDVADLVNSASGRYGGAITAALFLQEFVPSEIAWAHFDIMAWNNASQAGRPKGGEAMGLRACFECLKALFVKD